MKRWRPHSGQSLAALAAALVLCAAGVAPASDDIFELATGQASPHAPAAAKPVQESAAAKPVQEPARAQPSSRATKMTASRPNPPRLASQERDVFALFLAEQPGPKPAYSLPPRKPAPVAVKTPVAVKNSARAPKLRDLAPGDLAALYQAPEQAPDELPSPTPVEPPPQDLMAEQPIAEEPRALASVTPEPPATPAASPLIEAGEAGDDIFQLVTQIDEEPLEIELLQTETTSDSPSDLAMREPAPEAPAETAMNKLPARRDPLLMSIRETTVDLAPVARRIDDEETSTKLPENLAASRFGDYKTAAVGGNEMVRFAGMDYLWASPAMRHKPLYFEQPNLERYGSSCGCNCLSSLGATTCFVASALSLPYQYCAQPPGECVYTLGVYRPGNCNPHFFHLSPCKCRGGIGQGAAVAGLIFLFP